MTQTPLQTAPKRRSLSPLQSAGLVALRIVIGWLFLYEGMLKITDPNWTAAPFLAESRWLLSGFFQWVAATPWALSAANFLNAWGLTAIGLGLMLGALTRSAACGGIALLALYYVANPSLIAINPGAMSEGNYLLIDKNLVILAGLVVVLLFPTGRIFGLDRLIGPLLTRRRPRVPVGIPPAPEPDTDADAAPPLPTAGALVRRDLLKTLGATPVLGAFALTWLRKRRWESLEQQHLWAALDGTTSATLKVHQFSDPKDLEGQVPKGRIGDLEISRLIMGGNLIGGWAHARDLLYVDKLVKAYHSDDKVFDTLRLAEHCGINTLLTNPQMARVINEYWRRQGGHIQFISDCGYFDGGIVKGVDLSVEAGAKACYFHGGMADDEAKRGNMDIFAEVLERIRSFGLPAGIGAHRLETVKTCVEAGIKPDFWVKTLHRTDYWSSDPDNQHDNIWCVDPADTIAYMNAQEAPWIAFKILAAGALHPRDAFRYAFQNGADFICVGMYDFQIVDDTNIALGALNEVTERSRPWRG